MKKTNLLAVIASLVIAIFLLGCEKEKAQAPVTEPLKTGISGTCEILGKLPKDMAKPLEINFGNRIKLIGITINKESKEKLKLTYYWKLMDTLDAYNTPFAHFTDKDNKGVFQEVHRFCPQKAFEELKGKIIKETYDVPFPQSARGLELYVKIGLYDPKMLGRLKIESADGIQTDDGNTRAIVEKFKL
jgi:hypothetical protein